MQSSNNVNSRIFGVELVGSIPWGTHLCQFYESKQDLIDILVPYFAAGLSSNEFCMWVTSSPLEVAEAKEALRKAVPDLDEYLRKGQIDIVSYKDWYLLDGKFDSDRVLQGWVKKETDALKHGFDGLRLTGNTFWVERNLWQSFVDYEEAVNAVIGKHKMLALCTYCLKNISGTDVIDVVRNHFGTLLKQGKKWVLVEDAIERKKNEEELLQAKNDWERTFDSVPDLIAVLDKQHRIVRVNQAMAKQLGVTPQECIGLNCYRCVHGTDMPPEFCPHSQSMRDSKEHTAEVHEPRLGGDFLVTTTPLRDTEGQLIGSVHIARNITELKKAEKQLFSLAKFPSENPYAVLRISKDGTVMYTNAESQRLPKQIRLEIGQTVPYTWRPYLAEALASNRSLEFEETADARFFKFKVAPIPPEGYANVYGSDITESKNAENALRQSEQRWSTTLSSIGDAVIATDVNGNVTFMNNVAENMTGWTLSQAMGKSIKDVFKIINEKTRQEVENPVTRVLKEGMVVGLANHTVLIGKNGTEVPIDDSGAPIRDKDGKVAGVVLVFRDIVNRKKAEEALRANEIKFRTVANFTYDWEYWIGPDGNVIYMSPSCFELTGYTVEEFINDPKLLSKIVCPEDKKLFDSHFELTNSDKAHEIDFRIITRNNSQRWIAHACQPVFDNEGKWLGRRVSNRDITDRKQAEEELRKSERQYRSLFSNMTSGFAYCKMIFDRQSKPVDFIYLQINDMFEKITGLKKDIVIGRKVTEVIPGIKEATPELFNIYGRVARTGKGEKFEINFTPLGKWLSISVYSPEKGYFAAVFEDITERKKVEEEARRNEALNITSKYARSLIEASLDPLVTISTVGKILDVNQATEQVTGLSRQQLIGSDFSNYFTEPEKAKRGYQEVFIKGFVKDYPLAIRHISGKITDVLYNATVYRNEAGDIQGVFAAARDVTDRKKAEAAVQTERKRFYDVLETLPTMVCLLTPDHHVVFANRSFREKFGESHGRHCYDYCFGNKEPCPFCESYRVLETGKPHQWEVTGPDGSVIEAYDFPFSDVDGSPLILEMDIDVTRRKKAEEQLRTASLYTRSLIEASLDPLVTINAEGKITDVNKATEEVTGCLREELIGSDFSDYFTQPEDARKGYQQVFSEGFVRDYPLAIRHKSGKITYVLYNATVYRNEQGQIQGIFAAARDVTERKQAEEKLREASLYSRSLIEASLDPLVTINAEGKITDVNKATEEVTGYSREQLIGSDFSDYFLEPDKARAGYQQVFTEGFVKDYPLAICHQNGKITDVLYNATVYRNKEGSIEGVFAAARDVTEKKQAEEKLRAASLYARSLIEASLDPLVTINAKGKITDVNQATENVTGSSREQLIDSDFSNYFTEPEQARKGYQQVFTDGFVTDYPLAIRHVSGKITDVLYNATLFRNEAGEVQGVFASARDITQRKLMENELRTTLEKLKQSNAELEQFAYVASHDLQEPLRMVASYVQLLERRYKGKLDPEADEFINYAVDGANRMRGLIDDLLTYSRVGRLGKPFEPTSLESTLDIVLKNLQASIAENNAKVTHDELPVVIADGGQLAQLFQNLISNAIKFHGEEPPHVHISVKVQKTEYLFSVSDNGIGIDPQYFERLFRIFQRLHTREEYPGSGIGLAICKKIVERHGGHIWIESELGKGSTIYFTISKKKD